MSEQLGLNVGFGDYDLDAVPELHTLPIGEAELRLISAELKQQKPDKGTGYFLQLKFQSVTDPNAENIMHIMMLPQAEKEERTNNNRLRALKDFAAAYGVPCKSLSELINNVYNSIGNSGFALLKIEESPEYGAQNRISKFVVR